MAAVITHQTFSHTGINIGQIIEYVAVILLAIIAQSLASSLAGRDDTKCYFF